MQGWIKLHRKLLDNPIILNAELLQLFIYCLLKANHEDKKIIFNGKDMIIERGQFITGRSVLGKELKQNGRTTYDRLKILSNLQILTIKSNNRFSLVTVVNYDSYQMEKEKSNTKTNNKPTTSQQQANTNKNDKNDKNDKKIKIIGDFETEIKNYTQDINLITAINNYIEHRQSLKKPIKTITTLKLIFKELDKHHDKIGVLEQSIVNGWQGIFELKTQKKESGGNIFDEIGKERGYWE